MRGGAGTNRRGSPLAVMAILMVAWVAGRAAIWQNPFAPFAPGLPPLIAGSGDPVGPFGSLSPDIGQSPVAALAAGSPDYHLQGGDNAVLRFAAFAQARPAFSSAGHIAGSSPYYMEPRIAAGHQMLLAAALSHLPAPQSFRQASAMLAGSPPPPFAAPVLPQPVASEKLDRWSLDTWAFWRQGSNASAITQGRVPIYGASQAGANLQFRLAPNSSYEPRAYVRAYRALVDNGEAEFAAGFSARPLAGVPLRAQAEVRVTDNAFRTEVRPAAFVVTELAPQRLHAGLLAEAYGQGGYVGGSDATAFVDGQLTVTRPLAEFDLASGKSARLSLGAGAWGGAQKDATRVDLGPTMRVDLTIGKVPARLSVDWREQVAGDAAPASGVAATLSTRF